MTQPRIYLSPPHLGPCEETYVRDAFASNWIAPLGPHVDAFEAEFAAAVGARHALALSSGTAALHLSLLLAGVGPGDEVPETRPDFHPDLCRRRHCLGLPGWVDIELVAWIMDPVLLVETLDDRAREGCMPGRNREAISAGNGQTW